MNQTILESFVLTEEVKSILSKAKNITIPENREHLLSLALGAQGSDLFEVAYDVEGKGKVVEAKIAKCKNGAAVNYEDIYMRRRDPDSMVIGDDQDTDKETYRQRYGKDFGELREKTFSWLGEQNLIVMPFMMGDYTFGYPGLLIAPDNAGFFAAGLADLQGFIPKDEIPEGFKPRAIIYLAPPFRHTHFNEKQTVVHNRLEDLHEVFSFNLYPGPSAKKGVYGILLSIGEREGWTTLHASTVKVTTPYDNVVTIMHEGASGGGKSEMIEQVHREEDGKVLLGYNSVNEEGVWLELSDICELSPVTDDMALAHPALQNNSKKLVVKDAESGWFLRVDHITKYGTSPHYEKLTVHPKEPLIFINIDGAPGSTALIWEHIEDEPGKCCPNPRVIMPRNFVPNVVADPVEVDIRSFGLRAPLCTKENPSYGIAGMIQILPPALGWLWRLVAPRGHGNPSITDESGMMGEGVGSYWPFATGKMVRHANLLLEQIMNTPSTRFVLIPNQHIGAYRVGFAAQWIAREYLARRGSAKFKPEQMMPARSPLFGYSLKSLKINGTEIPKGLLRPDKQLEVGRQGYDEGARILSQFFKKELQKYLTPDLHPLGKEIIKCCMGNGSVEDYINLIPMK